MNSWSLWVQHANPALLMLAGSFLIHPLIQIRLLLTPKISHHHGSMYANLEVSKYGAAVVTAKCAPAGFVCVLSLNYTNTWHLTETWT